MPRIDFDAFRLRRLVDRLIQAGEVEVHDEPLPLAALSAIIEASDKATLFRRAGPEGFEIVAAVAGGRRRLAIAMGVEPADLALEYLRRMKCPQSIVEVPSADAPVHQVVATGDEVDLTTLPFHVQHQLDGAPYISSAIDFSVDPATGYRNVGCRRLMLCGRRELRANLTQMSDLKRIYLAAAARGEHLPVNFTIGSHPIDLLAANVRVPLDEFELIGRMRGSPVPMVKALTNDILVPADAELVIEGYFDKAGYQAVEGPYGELLGYYGPLHENPVFQVTAVTMRKDVLHQTVLHGAVRLARTDAAQIGSVLLEARIWEKLRGSSLEVIAVNGVAATGGRVSARASISPKMPGQSRLAIAAMFSVPFLKHVVVTDGTIDIFSDEEVEWAMSSRFRPERDLVMASGHSAFAMDVTAGPDRLVAKLGFDLTSPPAVTGIRAEIAAAPQLTGERWATNVGEALAAGPRHFTQLMVDLGSEDGREIVIELEKLRETQAVGRREDGAWCLAEAPLGLGSSSASSTRSSE